MGQYSQRKGNFSFGFLALRCKLRERDWPCFSLPKVHVKKEISLSRNEAYLSQWNDRVSSILTAGIAEVGHLNHAFPSRIVWSGQNGNVNQRGREN